MYHNCFVLTAASSDLHLRSNTSIHSTWEYRNKRWDIQIFEKEIFSKWNTSFYGKIYDRGELFTAISYYERFFGDCICEFRDVSTMKYRHFSHYVDMIEKTEMIFIRETTCFIAKASLIFTYLLLNSLTNFGESLLIKIWISHNLIKWTFCQWGMLH